MKLKSSEIEQFEVTGELILSIKISAVSYEDVKLKKLKKKIEDFVKKQI